MKDGRTGVPRCHVVTLLVFLDSSSGGHGKWLDYGGDQRPYRKNPKLDVKLKYYIREQTANN